MDGEYKVDTLDFTVMIIFLLLKNKECPDGFNNCFSGLQVQTLPRNQADSPNLNTDFSHQTLPSR